jgi:GntR family transcriptional regulator
VSAEPLTRYGAVMNSTNRLPAIEPGSPVALHEQVAAAIRRAIADGEIGSGERMPPARDLAAVLGVNANTVLRALRRLRDEGLLEFRRGRGITVTGVAPQRNAVIAQARELAAVARKYGYRPEEVAEILRQVTLEPL